jgi:hypothetical protein
MSNANHTITLEGQTILQGDSLSASVIFGNLSGMNFSPERKAAWTTQTHEEYLAYMKVTLEVPCWIGELKWLNEKGEVQGVHTFPAPAAIDGAPE